MNRGCFGFRSESVDCAPLTAVQRKLIYDEEFIQKA